MRNVRPLIAVVVVLWSGAGLSMAADDVFTYDFDSADQLTNVRMGSVSLGSYTYDGDGLRVSKTIASGSVYYVRDEEGRTVAEYDQGGALIAEYVYLQGERTVEIDNSGQRVYYHSDLLGTPLATTGGDAGQEFRGEYGPFGAQVLTEGGDPRHLFVGQEFDRESRLHYFNARYYDAALGRFISVDPVSGTVGDLQSWNRYSYALNNPTSLSDPLGLAVDMSGLTAEQQGLVIGGLNAFTGNTYSVSGCGMLKRDRIGAASSPTATAFLDYVIGVSDITTVVADNGNPRITRGGSYPFQVVFDFLDLDAFSFHKVNEAAHGLGASFVHELDHAFFGNSHSREERAGGPIGATVQLVNQIRSERGYGQRLTYPPDDFNRVPFSHTDEFPPATGIRKLFSTKPHVKIKTNRLDR
jgi:RHS repeat-associated protein